ncbi:rhodanese-like domain-containing protein [Crateriforma spongiae]|uniref:rhodanese-like domain-containing protein n=1 Tax=Crateriforma spongiae TaxID=2724528 RepID=UPI0014463E03|nr:rhodanese-like domain-containing protein [Crateriforma spongiae]
MKKGTMSLADCCADHLGAGIIRLCNFAFAVVESGRCRLGRTPVRTITTNDLVHWLESDERSPVLVDVRSDAELAISRISGAITRKQFESDPRSYSGRPVVAYCTVGGRSYLFAAKLVDSGVDAVNYRDSILGWCNAGLPLVKADGRPTTDVHPYWRLFKVPDSYQVRMSS